MGDRTAGALNCADSQLRSRFPQQAQPVPVLLVADLPPGVPLGMRRLGRIAPVAPARTPTDQKRSQTIPIQGSRNLGCEDSDSGRDRDFGGPNLRGDS